MEKDNFDPIHFFIQITLVVAIFIGINYSTWALGAVLVFCSYYAAMSYFGWTSLTTGLSTSGVVAEEEYNMTPIIYSFIYSVAVICGYFFFPIWAALLTPWVYHLLSVNFISYLIHKGYVSVVETDDDDEEDK